MQDLPRYALSIRQPWAWAILHAGKRVENRDWRTQKGWRDFRGPVCLHAARGMGKREYEGAADFIERIGGACPPAVDLPRGGIVGVAEIVDWVTQSDSPWFAGSGALVLTNARPVPFVGVAGALGFFDWRANERTGREPPAPWMTKTAREEFVAEQVSDQDDLFGEER